MRLASRRLCVAASVLITAWLAACGGITRIEVIDETSDSGPSNSPSSSSTSSATSNPTGTGNPPPPTFDGGPPLDAGPFDAGGQLFEAGSGSCPMPVDPSQIPVYKSPKSGGQGSCSAADISAVQTQLNNAMATFTDVYDAVSASCRGCMFASSGDANWALITWQPDMAAGTAFIDYGACFELAPGGSTACGKGVQDDQFCLDTACPQTCTDQQACVSSASMGACKTQNAEVTSGCGSSLTALDAKCGRFIDALSTVCGGGSFDAGGG